MPDPILLDKNVITSIARNNKPAAEALRRYLASGTPVYIARAAYDELVTRAQTPKQGGEYEWLLKDAGIQIAPSGKLTDRGNVYADNIEHVPGPNRPQLKTFSRADDPTKPGDVFVAAQAKAIGARVWSFDKKVQNASSVLGYQTAPECAIKDVSGPEDPTLARKLLYMNPKPIGPDGKPLPNHQPPGKSGGTYSVIGVGNNSLPEVGGPSTKGQAIIGGIQIAFEGINFVLNLVNEEIQKRRINEALDKVKPLISQSRQNNPQMGILLLFYYTQFVAPEDSTIKPGAAFDYVLWGKGVTRDEALREVLSQPMISRGTGAYERRFSKEVWIPPLQKSASTTAKCPFPPIAIARFALGKSNKAKFQLVEFSTFGGFDDVAERFIELPDNTNADFAVLQSPSQIFWFNLNGRQAVDVPLKDAETANGNVIKVIDLDPWSPFNAKAAMVFPVDDWTEQVFSTVPATNTGNLLSLYVNFRMIRWVRPENIHLLRFL